MTRNTERTRQVIFEATVRAVVRDGSGVAIGTIARDAGVSKSGLLHHFPTREALFEAVTSDVLDGFRRDVLAHLDLAENRPGKLLRAYVRAVCDDLEREEDQPGWEALALLRSEPGVAALVSRDAVRWETDLAADGLDPDRVVLVQLATDGLAAMPLQSEEIARRYLARMRPMLLSLAEPL
ncbi:TetR family transcriptional regulator [Actinoplanes bogorensis]|uniref:TetR family transcriptional regulator n=1 Tax=Paractinoplanes bogorensis TaxID=1610840 RepID=A0ABS5YRR1_9ACTN|nr:TetR family transcriptional regulator [Actinoplanes bogorensis]MBU2666129.1 TetR family transcriptional regulator [Actinoplanes bogorensis]